MTDTSSLIERVRAATGPDRNLDAMLHHWALDGVGTGYYADSPQYSNSVDASVALVERLLPGWRLKLFQRSDGKWFAHAQTFNFHFSSREENATSLPLAILLVTLLSIQETKNAE